MTESTSLKSPILKSQGSLPLEQFRLSVKFQGGYTIHPSSKNHISRVFASESDERWVQIRQIGKGAFGDVWLQQEEAGGELRAVKRLSQVSQQYDFSRELVTLATLVDNKRLFVQFYGWYEDIARAYVFLSMEFIALGDLSKYILEPAIRSEAKEITTQLLRGLAVMHERLICHRDIKPQNILVVSLQPMWVKIADFGVSKLEKDTYLRTAAGTLAYSAPEIFGLLPKRLRPRDIYTNAVDMWSLGCLVHEMLTTERPFLEGPQEQDPDFDSMTCEPQADIDLIIDFCRNHRDFPEEALQRSGVSPDEKRFVRQLLMPDPRLRLSAVNALVSPWILGESVSGSTTVVTAMSGLCQRLTRFVALTSLEKFYPEIPKEFATRAGYLATECVKRGCPMAIATSLETLVLYDLTILIGDGNSMMYDQNGERIGILKRMLESIASVYNLARETGISSVRFLNSAGVKNVVEGDVHQTLNGREYAGITRVGTGLKEKILKSLVVSKEMSRPMLVIVMVGQEPEGESQNLLLSVINDCLTELRNEASGSKGPNSIVFQFLLIGDSNDGKVYEDLANNLEISASVSYHRFRTFDPTMDSTEYWIAMTKIFLRVITEQ